jgi:hypothetical protein
LPLRKRLRDDPFAPIPPELRGHFLKDPVQVSVDPAKKEQMLATDIRQLILRICGKNATRSLDWATVENAVGVSKVVLVTAHGLPSILPLHSQTNKESMISSSGSGRGCGNIPVGESVTQKKRQIYTELPFLRRAKFQSKEKPLTQRKAVSVKVFAGRQTTDVGRVVLRAPPGRSNKSNEGDKKRPIPRASALDTACPPELLVRSNAFFAMRQMLHAVI